MLVGIGIDVVQIKELAAQLADRASRFVEATFTPEEVAYSRGATSGEPARHLAARYAAKEAAIKAFDLACAQRGVTKPSVQLSEIEVTRDEAGRPWLSLHGAASDLAERLGADRAWLSLSHDGDYATAVVALERLA
jgi:holo-[acyl-carrier protein] synthase